MAYFPTEPIRFKKYFNDLCYSRRNGYKVHPDYEYSTIRPDHLPWYHIYAQRSNIVTYLSNQLTQFKNNLKEHPWHRLRRFFNCFEYNGEPFTPLEITNTLKYLLNEPTDEHREAIPNDILLKGLRAYGWNGEKYETRLEESNTFSVFTIRSYETIFVLSYVFQVSVSTMRETRSKKTRNQQPVH